MATSPNPYDQFDTGADSTNPYDQFDGSAPAPISVPQIVGNVGIGAAKEAASQVRGVANVVWQGLTTPPLSARANYSPEQVAESQQWVRDIGQAVTSPVGTAKRFASNARDAIGNAVGTLTTRPQTAEQAQQYGATALRSAEALYGAGSVAKAGADVALSAAPVRRAAERIAVRGEQKAALAAAAVEPKNQIIRDVRSLGLRLTPQQAGGTTGKVLEGVSGAAKLERVVSKKNAVQVNRIVARDVGLDPKNPLTESSVQAGIKDALTDYTAPRKLGRVSLADDVEYKAALKDAEAISAQEVADFPGDITKSVQDEVAKFSVASADADSIVTKVAKLRERASANFRSGDAASVELARAQRKIATALEDAVERHGLAAGQQGVIEKFRASRQRLAKLYDVRDALTESGNVDLAVLARKLDKGDPLSGNLKTLAQAKKTFDRSFQNVDKIRDDVPIGVLDAAGGITLAAATNPYLAAVALARPGLRGTLASEIGQKVAIAPKAASPSLLTRSARAVANRNALAALPPQNALAKRSP